MERIALGGAEESWHEPPAAGRGELRIPSGAGELECDLVRVAYPKGDGGVSAARVALAGADPVALLADHAESGRQGRGAGKRKAPRDRLTSVPVAPVLSLGTVGFGRVAAAIDDQHRQLGGNVARAIAAVGD